MPYRSTQEAWLFHFHLAKEATSLIREQKYRSALKIIKKSLSICSNHATLYYLCSLCFYLAGDIGNGQRFYHTAVSMNPLCEIYELELKEALIKIEQILLLSIQYENKLNMDKEELVVNNWYDYTVALHEATDFQQTEQVYARLFAMHPQLEKDKSYAFLGNYANVLYDMGKYNIAVEKYELEIKRDPSELRFFSNCAVLYTILNDCKKAEEYIRIALRKMPERTNFIFNYANVLSKMGKFEESNDNIKKCIQKQPHDPIFRVKLAINISTAYSSAPLLALAQDNLRKSIAIFTQSLSTNNNDLVNCGRRILSTKNVTCLKYFSELLLDLLEVGLHGDFSKLLSYFSDYLIVGQATKIDLNYRIMDWLKELQVGKMYDSETIQGDEAHNNNYKTVKTIGKKWQGKIREACILPSLDKSKKWIQFQRQLN